MSVTLALAALLQGRASEALDAEGGGADIAVPRSNCLTETQRAEIKARLAETTQQLLGEGALASSALSVKLVWPMGPAPGLNVPATHGISAFVDEEPLFGSVRDYACGTRTYDLSNYNHQGVDIYSWPFAWYRMDQSQVLITAAAPGTIIGKDDGNFDRSCGINGNPWNAVYVRHDDNSVAWYGHMKNGSPTTKAVGQRVAAGEYLGVVGSSGSSTGPHLHLELYDAAGHLTESYAGACNRFASSTSWVAQRPYYDSAINEIATHSAPPVFPSCGAAETPNYRDVFPTGGLAYFAAYYRDQLEGQQTVYTILRPDGSVANTWTHTRPAGAPYSSSYWYWSYTLPATPQGAWKFRAQFQGQTVEHGFVVGALPAISVADAAIPEGHSATSLLAFAFTLSYSSTLVTTVSYSTADASATAGSDYVAASGTITFAPGETSRLLLVSVNGDLVVEPDETFTLNLSAPVGATLARAQATGGILHDDPPAAAQTTPQYRLYNVATGEHLYSTDPNEYAVLGTHGWLKEGVAYQMFSTSGTFAGATTVPFYRLYNTAIAQHHWTLDPNEAFVLSGHGWFYEGVIGYLLPPSPIAPAGTTALYRLNLPSPPLHLWTTDAHEYDVLGNGAWSREGIVGYVVP
jgi:murein DD-endopeptidase MepM/ murein hydrolase activator NlpD